MLNDVAIPMDAVTTIKHSRDEITVMRDGMLVTSSRGTLAHAAALQRALFNVSQFRMLAEVTISPGSSGLR